MATAAILFFKHNLARSFLGNGSSNFNQLWYLVYIYLYLFLQTIFLISRQVSVLRYAKQRNP